MFESRSNDLNSSRNMLSKNLKEKIIIEGQNFEKCSQFQITSMFMIQNSQKNTNYLIILKLFHR